MYSVYDDRITPAGLLHSDICGSIPACDSPQLFAAYRVLRRLPMPRHPPCALISLTSFYGLSSLCVLLRLKFEIAVFTFSKFVFLKDIKLISIHKTFVLCLIAFNHFIQFSRFAL